MTTTPLTWKICVLTLAGAGAATGDGDVASGDFLSHEATTPNAIKLKHQTHCFMAVGKMPELP